jgi:hypothetical protein
VVISIMKTSVPPSVCASSSDGSGRTQVGVDKTVAGIKVGTDDDVQGLSPLLGRRGGGRIGAPSS